MTIRRLVVLIAAVSALAVLAAAPAGAAGAKKVSGTAFPGTLGDAPCDDAAHVGADYSIEMTGDLAGCVYGYITSFAFHEGSGVYKERADETFAGCYGAVCGTFEMKENFTGKFDLDTGNEIHGRCKHPIVSGSGTGGFAGVTGRLDFKDDVSDPANPVFPYKGHLKLA